MCRKLFSILMHFSRTVFFFRKRNLVCQTPFLNFTFSWSKTSILAFSSFARSNRNKQIQKLWWFFVCVRQQIQTVWMKIIKKKKCFVFFRYFSSHQFIFIHNEIFRMFMVRKTFVDFLWLVFLDRSNHFQDWMRIYYFPINDYVGVALIVANIGCYHWILSVQLSALTAPLIYYAAFDIRRFFTIFRFLFVYVSQKPHNLFFFRARFTKIIDFVSYTKWMKSTNFAQMFNHPK